MSTSGFETSRAMGPRTLTFDFRYPKDARGSIRIYGGKLAEEGLEGPYTTGVGLPKGWRWPKSDPFGRINSGSGKFHGNPGKFSASIQSEMFFWFAGMLMVGTSNLLQFDLLSCRYLL